MRSVSVALEFSQQTGCNVIFLNGLSFYDNNLSYDFIVAFEGGI